MRSVFALAALLVLVSAGAFAWIALDRQIRVVKVEGQLAETEAAQIRRQIGRVLDGRLLTVDVAQLRDRVKALSWPGTVSVRKVWPDTIVVRVSRRNVVARWSDQHYLTPAGELVSTPNAPANLPEFQCALSSPKEAMEIYRYLQGMASAADLLIRRVSENEIGEWQLVIAGARPFMTSPGASLPADLLPGDAQSEPLQPDASQQLIVMLGADSLRERMQRFLLAWSRLLERRAHALDYVDLRYGNGMAVRWREPNVQHAEAVGTTAVVETT